MKRLACLFFLLMVVPASADITSLPWSTTFDCSTLDVTNAYCSANSGDDICDGWEIGTCSSLNSGISAGSNYSGGDGGNGLYWQVGDGNTTGSTGPTGSGFFIDVPDSTPQIYLRWYFYHPSGMPLSHSLGFSSHKLLYIYFATDSWYFDQNTTDFRLYDRDGTSGRQSTNNWDDFYDNAGRGGGSWHAMEVYISSSGVFRMWEYVDGVDNPTPVIDENGLVTYGNLRYLIFPSNVKTDFTGADNGQTFTVYYDDIAISTTGRIGPLSASTDPLITVTATDSSATEEGTTTGTFTITSDTAGPLTVAYSMSGTATSGTDYSAVSGSASIASGQYTATVTITPVDDSLSEGDEAAILTITDGATYDLGTPNTATIVLTDNDQAPPPPVTLLYLHAETGSAGLTAAGCYDDINQRFVIDTDRATRSASTFSSSTAYNIGDDVIYSGQLYKCVVGHAAGSWNAANFVADNGYVFEYRFTPGAYRPTNGSGTASALGSLRAQFSQTPEIYVKYKFKSSTNYVGNGLGTYADHWVYLETDADSAWAGLANTHLTAYMEHEYNNILTMSFQDAKNLDLDGDGQNDDQIGTDLTANFSQGAAHGGHGNFTNAGTGVSCYFSGSSSIGNLNVRWWEQSISSFADGQWHEVMYRVKMNTLTGSTINQDGILQMWIDDFDSPVFTATNVVIKKGWYTSQFFNQVVLGPYLSGQNDLSADQVIWIDDFFVGTADGDVSPPVVSGWSPAKNATGVSKSTNISFVVSDSGGVNRSSIVLYEEGNKHCPTSETCSGGTADLATSGTTASYTVTLNPSDYSDGQEVNVSIDASDTDGNAMVTDVYKFDILPVVTGLGIISGGGSATINGDGAGSITGQ